MEALVLGLGRTRGAGLSGDRAVQEGGKTKGWAHLVPVASGQGVPPCGFPFLMWDVDRRLWAQTPWAWGSVS